MKCVVCYTQPFLLSPIRVYECCVGGPLPQAVLDWRATTKGSTRLITQPLASMQFLVSPVALQQWIGNKCLWLEYPFKYSCTWGLYGFCITENFMNALYFCTKQ